MKTEDHGRAHVRLGEDQDAGEGGDEDQRADDAAVGGVLVEAAGDEVRGEERERQLHELGRLQAELPEADPSARPHGVHPEAGHQHDEEEPERHQEEQGAEPPQLAVVDAQGQPQRHDADRHPHGLPDQDRPRRAVGRDGDHRGGGADHHEPDDAQQRDVDEQHGRDRELAPADTHAGRSVRAWRWPRAGRRPGGSRSRGRRPWRTRPAQPRSAGRRGAPLSASRQPPPPGVDALVSPVRHPMHGTSFPHRMAEVADEAAPGHVNFATVRKSP